MAICKSRYSHGPLAQGDQIPSGQEGQENSVFKIRRYGPDYLGFKNRELIPGDPIELPRAAVDNPHYPVVDTGQTLCYNNIQTMKQPAAGEAFYGQDANYLGNTPVYIDNGNGAVTDGVTGLMWQKSPDRNADGKINYADKLSYDEAQDSAASFRLGGYNDWRLPTIHELYSLIMFSGAEE